MLGDYTVERLAGGNRYETNLKILKAANVKEGSELIVATGTNFADSLSASAAKLPILMVKKALTADQKAFLGTMKPSKIYIVGGESADVPAVEAELKAYGNPVRLAGDNRRETSIKVAEAFAKDSKVAVVASAANFPDGLCGGPLAAALDAPLILTTDKNYKEADTYMNTKGITAGYVLGGTSALIDDAVVAVYNLNNAGEIKAVTK